MNKQKLTSLIGPALVLVAFIAYAIYILIGLNADVLYTAQDRNFYVGGSVFFNDTMSRPFGLFQYVGAYLTQLFYHPALGAGVLIAIWVAIVLVGIKAFNLKGTWCTLMVLPAACLLASTVDLGYWVYCLIIPGYWFSQSVVFLCFLLLLWAANATPRRFRIVWYVVIGFAGFPVFGWVSYLFALCLALSQFKKGTYPSWIDSTGIVLAAVAPLVFRAIFYKSISPLQVYIAGFPYFKTFTDESVRPSIPFFIIIGIFLILSLSGIFRKEGASGRFVKSVSIALPLLVVAVSCYGVWASMFHDDNYIYEMQMNRATMDDDWKGVISIAEKTKTPSRTMVMLKNIALMNTGELGERSFDLSNSGIEINNSDSLNLNIMQIAAPVIYYNYGKVNYAMRWSMEFGVSYGFSPFYYKILARCAELTGEKELAERYKGRLHSTMFYADWEPKRPTPVVMELQSIFPDLLDDDSNSCERYLLSTFSKSQNISSAVLCDLNLFYAILVRNPDNFWLAFCNYIVKNKGKRIPKSYQEAYCLFADKVPVKIPYEVKISPEIVEKYKAFWATGNSYAQYYGTEDAVREAMAEEWGNTYWWFNAFGRNAY